MKDTADEKATPVNVVGRIIFREAAAVHPTHRIEFEEAALL